MPSMRPRMSSVSTGAAAAAGALDGEAGSSGCNRVGGPMEFRERNALTIEKTKIIGAKRLVEGDRDRGACMHLTGAPAPSSPGSGSRSNGSGVGSRSTSSGAPSSTGAGTAASVGEGSISVGDWRSSSGLDSREDRVDPGCTTRIWEKRPARRTWHGQLLCRVAGCTGRGCIRGPAHE